MANPDLVVRSVKSALRWLVIATGVLYVALGVVAIKSYHDSARTQSALCALRADLQARVRTSEGFLREHPRGVAGIPARTIQEGIVNQRRTIKALSALSC
jgi:sulfur transfer complex TusBCD TusB component (DsrH family)